MKKLFLYLILSIMGCSPLMGQYNKNVSVSYYSWRMESVLLLDKSTEPQWVITTRDYNKGNKALFDKVREFILKNDNIIWIDCEIYGLPINEAERHTLWFNSRATSIVNIEFGVDAGENYRVKLTRDELREIDKRIHFREIKFINPSVEKRHYGSKFKFYVSNLRQSNDWMKQMCKIDSIYRKENNIK